TETSESIAVLDQELVRLEQNPEDKEGLSNIFRLVHTIKGTCGFLGLPRLENVAHAGENGLGKLRGGEVKGEADHVTRVLEALDTIKFIMDYLAGNGQEPEGNDDHLKVRLNAVAAGGAPPPVAKAPEPVGEEPAATLEELEAAFNTAPGPEDRAPAIPAPA